MSFDEFSADYNDLVGDILHAGYETYETKLADWIDLISNSPVSRDYVSILGQDFDFYSWYESAKSTVGSMVGSGRIPWASDRTERLAQLLALFKRFATRQISYIDFSSSFMYAGSRFDEMIEKINSELFSPFSRDLLKYIGRQGAAETEPSGIPASDRIVTLDHNSQSYTEATSSLDHVLSAVRESNEVGAGEPTTRERVISELDAGTRLLKAPEVRAQAVWAIVYPALRWASSQAAGTLLGVAITAAIALLATLLGVQIPAL